MSDDPEIIVLMVWSQTGSVLPHRALDIPPTCFCYGLACWLLCQQQCSLKCSFKSQFGCFRDFYPDFKTQVDLNVRDDY